MVKLIIIIFYSFSVIIKSHKRQALASNTTFWAASLECPLAEASNVNDPFIKP